MEQLDFREPGSVRDLNKEEIEVLIASCNSAQKEALAIALQKHNKNLEAELEEKKNEIGANHRITRILLKRVWRMLDQEDRNSLSSFFTEIDEEIAVQAKATDICDVPEEKTFRDIEE